MVGKSLAVFHVVKSSRATSCVHPESNSYDPYTFCVSILITWSRRQNKSPKR